MRHEVDYKGNSKSQRTVDPEDNDETEAIARIIGSPDRKIRLTITLQGGTRIHWTWHDADNS